MKNSFILSILLLADILSSDRVSAQGISPFDIIWKDSINSLHKIDGGAIKHFAAILPDSSIVFFTRKKTLGAFNSDSIKLSKTSLDGTKLIENRSFLSRSFVSTDIDLAHLEGSGDGNFFLIIPSGSQVYIAQFDRNLDLLHDKFIDITSIIRKPNPESSIIASFRNAVVHTNGTITLISTLIDITRGGFKPYSSSLFTVNSLGDSLLYSQLNDQFIFINEAFRGGNDKFGTIQGAFSRDINLALRSLSDTTVIRKLNFPNDVMRVSNVIYLPSKATYLMATIKTGTNRPYPGPNDFALQLLDSAFNFQGSIPYNNVNYLNPRLSPDADLNQNNIIYLIEDPQGGLMFYQYSRGASTTSVPTYLMLGRIDSMGTLLWSEKIDNPSIGVIEKIIPLQGNDFLVFTNTAIYRMRRHLTIASTLNNSINFIDSLKSLAEKGVSDLSVRIASNPSANYFTLIPKSSSRESLSLIVTDYSGRFIERKDNLPANGVFQIGNKYQKGIYIIKITQNGKSKILRLVKN